MFISARNLCEIFGDSTYILRHGHDYVIAIPSKIIGIYMKYIYVHCAHSKNLGLNVRLLVYAQTSVHKAYAVCM